MGRARDASKRRRTTQSLASAPPATTAAQSLAAPLPPPAPTAAHLPSPSPSAPSDTHSRAPHLPTPTHTPSPSPAPSPSPSPSPYIDSVSPSLPPTREQSTAHTLDSAPTTESGTSQSRLRLHLHNNLLEPSGSCSRIIRKTFEEKIDFEGIKWKTISQETKDFYFTEFKKRCMWDEAIDALIREAWRKKAAARYRDMISEIKKKGKKPMFINPEAWESWQQHWNTPEAQQISETYSKNRMSQATDGFRPSTHTGGTATHYEHGRRLAKKLGRLPTAQELFLYTHTKNRDGQTFIDDKSKSIHDAILSRREQLTQANETIDENNLFLDAVGGKQRNGIYGLGSQASEYYGTSGAATSTPLQSTQQNAEEINELRQRITQQDEVIKDLRDLTERLLQRMDDMSRTQRPSEPSLYPEPGHADDHDDDESATE